MNAATATSGESGALLDIHATERVVCRDQAARREPSPLARGGSSLALAAFTGSRMDHGRSQLRSAPKPRASVDCYRGATT
jgi:hypothetical protein